MRNNDEKISDNIDKSNENNKTVTMTGEGGSQEKKSAKTEQETTTNGGIETSKRKFILTKTKSYVSIVIMGPSQFQSYPEETKILFLSSTF